MSAQQLADRCEQLGFAIPRPVLSNLENGRRESVTLAELLILARALGVSLTELVAPVGRQDVVEILPGREARAWDAARWITGEACLRQAPAGFEVTAEVDVDDPLFLYRLHDSYLERWRSAARLLVESGDGHPAPDEHIRAWVRQDVETDIRRVRSRMRQLGLLLPPLPLELADVDELAEGSAHT